MAPWILVHGKENGACKCFQFPQGIEWGEGNIAYVVIGIAARSDEHLSLITSTYSRFE